jgi:hypothetical protein
LGRRRKVYDHPTLSFAKTGAALLPVTVATSRELIAPMITMIGRPERSDGTRVSRARQQLARARRSR